MTLPDATLAVSFAGRLGDFALDVAFEAPMRGITGLFGPSGCGKTTVLRCIAGLQRLPGRLSIGSDLWQDDGTGLFRPPHRREVGYVFQEASLFAHLTVRDNLLYGARRAARTGAAATIDLDGVVTLLGISHLLDRSTQALSGGERQRVAVGRALLSRPRLLLMDEPLSALDRISKEEILPYFEALHEQLAIPVLYVTHDFSEIERLVDTLILMERGRVTACGRLRDMQTDPRLPLILAPQATVVLEGRVRRFDEAFALTELDVDGGALVVSGRHGTIGDKRRLRIAASDVSLARSAPTDSTILNCLPARIVSIDGAANAPQVTVVLALGNEGAGSRIIARITRKSQHALGLAPADAVFAQIKSVALIASRAAAPAAP